MWAAARSRLPVGSPLYIANPQRVRGVVDLAGPLDLSANISGYERLCMDTVITALLGGTPATVPQRYAQASPIRMLPLGLPQVIVLGSLEAFVPRPLADAYVQAATQAGDSVRLLFFPRADHFVIASPRAWTWPKIESAIRSLLDGKLPPA